MALKTFALNQKISTIDHVLDRMRDTGWRSGDPETFQTMQSIAADLRGRQQVTRSAALHDLTRALEVVKGSQTGRDYDHGKLLALAYLVISKWPVISQALEQFAEETAE